MFYILYYLYFVIVMILTAIDLRNRKIDLSGIGYLLFLLLVILVTVVHFVFSYTAKKRIESKTSERVCKDLAGSFDPISITFLLFLFALGINLLKHGTGSMNDIEITAATGFIFMPVYISKHFKFLVAKNEINRLAEELKGYKETNKYIVFETDAYSKIKSKNVIIFIIYQIKFSSFFRKDPKYRKIYESNGFVFIPDIIESLIDEEYGRVAYKELSHKKNIEESIAEYIRQEMGSENIKEHINKYMKPLIKEGCTDQGKITVNKMIEKISDMNAYPVEYFYDLIKMAEYITNYQSLADYEARNSCYFNSKKEMSFGAFASNLTESNMSKYYQMEEFKTSYKYLSEIVDGKSAKLTQKNISNIIRMFIVHIRNVYIGHGTMTYSIEEELVTALVMIMCPLLDEFLNYSSDMKEKKIGELYKCHEDYLLICVYSKSCGLYLNYENGEVMEIGGKFKIQVS